MGRNNDTFTLIIDRNREDWSKFRRALRKEDQELFDEMWRAPKLHLAAGAFIAAEIPLETIFMTMLLEQYKKIKYLETAQYVRTVDAPPEAGPAAGGNGDTPHGRRRGPVSRATTFPPTEEN
jgi:hypothetical protein